MAFAGTINRAACSLVPQLVVIRRVGNAWKSLHATRKPMRGRTWRAPPEAWRGRRPRSSGRSATGTTRFRLRRRAATRMQELAADLLAHSATTMSCRTPGMFSLVLEGEDRGLIRRSLFSASRRPAGFAGAAGIRQNDPGIAVLP